jgi:lysozyme family protein
MADRFDACLPVILASEGGFVVDRGGPTNLGVTQATLTDWLGRQATIDDVRAQTPLTVAPLYRAKFWNTASCDVVGQYALGADLMMFDASVNQGPGTSIKILQRALGIKDDGVFGRMTTLALQGFVHTHPPGALIPTLQTQRAIAYRQDAGFAVDGVGWLGRNDRTAKIAEQMAQAA